MPHFPATDDRCVRVALAECRRLDTRCFPSRLTGGVVDTQITANVDGSNNDAVKDCVEKLVRTAKFPAVPTPLATSERSWTVASQ